MKTYNLEKEIPSYKIVEIRDNQGSIINSPLILDDDFSIKVNSKYTQLWESSPNNLMSLLSSSFGTPSGQFALQGAQIWQSTDPINISITVDLMMDTDPYSDVVYPTLVLMQTVLPTVGNGTQGISGKLNEFAEKHFNLQLKTLIPPGPNLQALATAMSSSPNNKNSILIASRNGAKGLYTVKIGFATFNNVIITSVEPTYSKEVSTSFTKGGKYYPIGAKLSIELSTMEIATTDMISSIC